MAFCKMNVFVVLLVALTCLGMPFLEVRLIRGVDGQQIKCSKTKDCVGTCLDPYIRCENGFCQPCPDPTKLRCKTPADCQEWCHGRLAACVWGKCVCGKSLH